MRLIAIKTFNRCPALLTIHIRLSMYANFTHAVCVTVDMKYIPLCMQKSSMYCSWSFNITYICFNVWSYLVKFPWTIARQVSGQVRCLKLRFTPYQNTCKTCCGCTSLNVFTPNINIFLSKPSFVGVLEQDYKIGMHRVWVYVFASIEYWYF